MLPAPVALILFGIPPGFLILDLPRFSTADYALFFNNCGGLSSGKELALRNEMAMGRMGCICTLWIGNFASGQVMLQHSQELGLC
jgi:hypothetical protein